jgi:DNA-binding NtrC family response regulator
MTLDGTFRQDLLFRINTIQIDLPPLRERGDDIDLMAHHFLSRYAKKYNRGPLTFARDALAAMRDYTWPGNIRELEHSIEKAAILAEGNEVRPDDLHLRHAPAQQQAAQHERASYDDYEREILKKALIRNGGNMSNAAKELGISRQTIYNKMKKYGL